MNAPPCIRPLFRSLTRFPNALLALVLLGFLPPLVNAQTAAPDWYDKEKLDAFGRNYAALLNAGELEEAGMAIPIDGIYGSVFADPLGEKKNDPEVDAYLKEFYPIFTSLISPKGGETHGIDFLQSGVEGGQVYLLMRFLPKNSPKAPELNYMQVVIQPGKDGSYLVSDVFSIRAATAMVRVAEHLFLLLMPEPVYQKIGDWSDAKATLYAQRQEVLAMFDLVKASDPACLEAFMALDPPRLDDLVLLDSVSKVVFENSDDSAQIKQVMELWQKAQPRSFSMLIWNACGMRRLGGDGYDEANKILDVLRGNELFANDAYLDVLSADHSMRRNKTDEGEQYARNAVSKEPNLFVARHILHLILAKKPDFDGIAKSLEELSRIDAAFTLKYTQDTQQLAAFRDSNPGKALLAELQK